MKNEYLFKLKHAIDKCKSLVGVKFAYALAKNAELIQGEIDALNASLKMSKEYSVFDKKRIELAKSHAKIENGIHVVKQKIVGEGRWEEYYEIGDQKAFDKAFEELKKANKKVVEAREKQLEEFNQLLKEESSKLKFYKIKLSDVPQNISSEQMSGIYVLVEEK